jgi:hypothetical protein
MGGAGEHGGTDTARGVSVGVRTARGGDNGGWAGGLGPCLSGLAGLIELGLLEGRGWGDAIVGNEDGCRGV